jgi:hypothetical protein
MQASLAAHVPNQQREAQGGQVVPKSFSPFWATSELEGEACSLLGATWGCELILHVVSGAGSQMADS